MRIDGTFGIEPHGTSDGNPTVAKGKASSQLPLTKADQEPAVVKSLYLSKALASSDVNMQAVERGLKALESGELDTLDAAQAAVDAMFNKGL